MTISVHVGLHKTGTTSIQAALATTKGNITRRQVHLRWSDLFVTDGVVDESRAERIRRLSMRGWHVVVSSEGGLGPMGMSQVYPHASQVVQRLDGLLGDQDLRVILYVRPQHEWAASAYAQHVRAGGTEQPRDFVAALLEQPYIRHTALVADLISGLNRGRLVVRPYRAGMDVVADFFDVASLGPVPAYLGQQRANESPSAGEIEATRKANEAGTDACAQHVGPIATAVNNRKRSPLPEDCQTELHALFVTDWARLSTLVAGVPGHRPSDFLREVDAARDWVPWPTGQHRLAMRTESPSRPEPSATAALPSESRMAERLQRWEFRLRHGPRHVL